MLSSTAFAATYVWVVEVASIGLLRARLVPVGGGSTGPPLWPWTSTSESWAAFQPVLAVTWTRRYRTVAEARPMVTVFAAAGSKDRGWAAARVVKVPPSVLPSTATVWERASQPVGSLRTASSTRVPAPRSICTHCGNDPAGPSQ